MLSIPSSASSSKIELTSYPGGEHGGLPPRTAMQDCKGGAIREIGLALSSNDALGPKGGSSMRKFPSLKRGKGELTSEDDKEEDEREESEPEYFFLRFWIGKTVGQAVERRVAASMYD